jgi:hypothetical protein
MTPFVTNLIVASNGNRDRLEPYRESCLALPSSVSDQELVNRLLGCLPGMVSRWR